MKLQTKISLTILPLIIGSILYLGWWSIKTASDGIYNSTYQYMTTVLNSYISDTVMRMQDILKKNGLDTVPSFVKQYQQKAFIAASKVSMPETGHILILKADGRFVFCTVDKKRKVFNNVDQEMLKNITKNPANTFIDHIHMPDGSKEMFVARYFLPWDWIIFLNMSEKEIASAKSQIRNATIFIVVISSLSAFILILLAFRIIFVGPITKLKDAASSIEKRESVVKIDVYSSDELGELARDMEAMSLSIQKYQTEQMNMRKKLESSNKALIVEISERERIEESLKNSEMQVRLLLDSTAEGIYGLDIEGNCTQANRACLNLLGYKSEHELIGKNMHNTIHHTHPGGSPYPVKECRICYTFRKGDGIHVDDEILWRSDGTSFSAEYWSYPIYREKEIVGAVATFLDITSRRRSEEELKKHRTHLEELVRERTTELRTTVNAMSGREIRMAELKEVIRKLRAQMESGGLTPVANDPLKEEGAQIEDC